MIKRFVALSAFLLVLSTSSAIAGQVARATIASNVSSANWSVQAVGANQSATKSSYLLAWNVSGGAAYDFFSLRNTGSITVHSFDISITQNRVGGSGTANLIDFEWCSGGVWNSSTNTCSGNVTSIGNSADLKVTLINLALIPGTEISVRAKTAVSGRNNFTTQLDVIVPRTGIRSSSGG